MLRIHRLFTCLLLVALVFSACQPITQQPTPTASPPQGLRSDAPPYGVRGPYVVGVRDFVIEPTQGLTRSLTVSVWYPALNPAGKPEAITYHLGFPTNTNPDLAIAGRALVDAALDLAGGPYPLVIYSHGGWAYRQDAVYLMEQLASYGFVVMAPLHEDNWGTLFENFYKSEISRPQDIVRTIDFAETVTADGPLAGLIDTSQVAVAGWSLGGQIAMEMGGARLNFAEQQTHYCMAFPDDQRCAFYTDHLEEMSALVGLDAVPLGYWPDWSDPRVDAVVLLEPAEGSLGAQPPALRVPVLLIEGTEDRPGYRMAGIDSMDKTGVIFQNAAHFIMGNSCATVPGMATAGYAMLCSDPVWDMDRSHDLVSHFVTAFLLAELKGDAEAAKSLAPANVAFPGIQYETTAFNKTRMEP